MVRCDFLLGIICPSVTGRRGLNLALCSDWSASQLRVGRAEQTTSQSASPPLDTCRGRSAGWNPTLNRLNWFLLPHILLFLVLHETPHSPRTKASATRDLSGIATAQWREHLTADPRGLRFELPPSPYVGVGVCYMSYHEDNTLPLSVRWVTSPAANTACCRSNQTEAGFWF